MEVHVYIIKCDVITHECIMNSITCPINYPWIYLDQKFISLLDCCRWCIYYKIFIYLHDMIYEFTNMIWYMSARICNKIQYESPLIYYASFNTSVMTCLMH